MTLGQYSNLARYVLWTGLVLLTGCSAEAELAKFLALKVAELDVTEAERQEDRTNYTIGKPYRISGTWYFPEEDFGYAETGLASRYGPESHGKPTTTGETYDMNKVSAAHRTLPLPSIVRVINLELGRSIRVRVNDRGPKSTNQIIRLSQRAARMLGFEEKGTALVRVEILAEESRRLKLLLQNRHLMQDKPVIVEPVGGRSVLIENLIKQDVEIVGQE